MRIRVAVLSAVLLVSLSRAVQAQFRAQTGENGPRLGQSQTFRWQAGMVITAAGGACTRLVGTAPVPFDWPEQQVQVVDEEVPPGAKLTYRMVEGGVKQMVVHIPYLPAGRQCRVVVTFEVTRHAILPPEKTDIFELPNTRRLPIQVRRHLAPSPLIESQNPRIRELARQITADKQSAWEKVEAIYDWVREHVEYKNGPLKGALAALNDGTGDCEELTSLFIALCRAIDIPARTVWVPGHCYPEFYLVDKEGKGYWFPCQAAGTRAFGGIPEYRPILQKGDNFRSPSNRRERKRYLPEELTGAGGRPRVQWIRQLQPG